MATQDCIDAIRTAFQGTRRLSDDDVEFMLDEIVRRTDQENGRFDTTTEGFMGAAREVAEETQVAARINRRNTRLQIRATRRMMALANEARDKFGNPFIGITAALTGSERPLRGGLRSVHNMHQALFYKHMGGMVAELDRAGLLATFNDGKLDLDIARALEKITKEDAPGTTHAEAIKIAEVIHKHRSGMFEAQNRKGSWVGALEGRITTQGHDMRLVRKAGFEEWKRFVLPMLDAERTFRGADPERFLSEAYKTIIAGQDSIVRGGEIDGAVEFIGNSALASRVSNKSRVLHFADADRWNTYNSRFGANSFRESLLFEMNKMARNTALMDVLGPNPHATLDRVIETITKQEIQAGREVDNLRVRFARASLRVADGTAAAPENISLANWSQGARTVQSLAKLGGATLSGIADIAFKATELRRLQGGGVVHPFTQAFTTFFDGIPSKDKRQIAESLGVGIEGMIGDVAQRMSSPESRVNVGNKAMRLFFKLNLLTPWTDAHKKGMGFFTANYLAKNARRNFADLPDQLPFMLRQFDIDERHWPILQQAIDTVSDGRQMMMPEKIRDVPDAMFIRQGLDPVDGREALENALRAFYLDIADTAIPTPGLRERTILTGGLSAGTPLGEGLRFMGQFKSFPVTVGTRVVNRLRFNTPDGRADWQGLAIMIAQTTLLGYMAGAAKDLSKGRTPRDFLDPKTFVAAMLQGGGAGIFGDFILGETNRFGRSFLDTLAGPLLGTISDIDELRAKLMFGDDGTATAVRLAMQNTPFLNLFYTRVAMDYLVLYHLQEMANPGYLRRTERRLQKEQGQTYIVPPSSLIQ